MEIDVTKFLIQVEPGGTGRSGHNLRLYHATDTSSCHSFSGDVINSDVILSDVTCTAHCIFPAF